MFHTSGVEFKFLTATWCASLIASLTFNFMKIFYILLFFSSQCFAQKQNLAKYVNPLIGTQRMGHVFPGATVPFGMVQLSPDTDTIPFFSNGKYEPDVYKYCAGYQYDDKTIVGFSHTHFSGTGHSDLGDFLIMPTMGNLQLNPGTADQPLSGYRSGFSHQNETAEPGYYQVLLDDDKINAELTATNRVGFHRYRFPAKGDAHIILDLSSGIYNYEDKNVWTFVRVENDSTLMGYRQTNGWARTRTVYFSMKFSKPFKSYGSREYGKMPYRGFWGKWDQRKNFPDLAGKQLRLHFDFDAAAGETIQVKMALSPTSMSAAAENMKAELPGWNFDMVRQKARDQWNEELNRIVIDADQNDKINFYTALYHTFLSPTNYTDHRGSYKGLDQEIHVAKGFTNYTTFSLWDTYRALHPLFNIIQPRRNADMVKSMLAHYEQSAVGMLPIWSHYANDNWCMSGYHAVSVIADAAIKQGKVFDLEKALDACVATARKERYEGIGAYMGKGYIPSEANGVSASTTLEYAYDDWCIAQLAKKIGRRDIESEFMKRSENYRHLFDKETGFMRAKMNDGSFKPGFDPLSTHGQGFIEGNSWNYSLFVPHKPYSLIELMGGKQEFVNFLDSLFGMYLPDSFFAGTEDITRDGIIGGYVHGNEPAHHVAYLYNYAGMPWKTQERVRQILKMQYKAAPDGLGGNDDAGQMSAWYIFSSLGFYPVSPGSNQYQLGSPLVKKAELNLENGKKFTVMVNNQSPENLYVARVELNGRPVMQHSITHSDLMNGGRLVFWMSNVPNK